MANLSLASYDGSAGFLVDTNIWVHCVDPASPRHTCAVDQLQTGSMHALVHVNMVIYTKLLVLKPVVKALDAMLDVCETQRCALPWS